ncbi:MAG: type II secretion system F family protein [bacterium]
MPKFRYVAMDSKGREVEGVLDAESEARAIASVKEKGLFPTSLQDITPGKGGNKGGGARGGRESSAKGRGSMQSEIKLPPFLSALFQGRIKTKLLMVFTRQLATLVEAGLPLLRGLHVLQRQEKNPQLHTAVIGMAESVESGSTFAEALAQYPKVFSLFYINMVKAGEASGALNTVLTRLAEFMEKSQKIRNKVRGAMVYPIVVMVMAMVILGVLMVFVIPKFKEIFDDLLQGKALPALTQLVIGASDLVAKNGLYLLAGIIGVVILFRMWGKTERGRRSLDVMKLKAPIFGQLVRKTAIANFTRTLGTLMTGGVPILQALNIVKEVTNNAVLAKAIAQVHDSVKEGETIVSPLEASGVFPAMVVSMIQVGEETGALPEMLMKVAENYDDEVDTAVEALTSIIEPIMIIFLAVVVGTIVIAMFLPLVTIIGSL